MKGLFASGRSQNRNWNNNGSKTKYKSKSRSKLRTRGKKCFYRQKEGHFIKDQYKKKREDKEKAQGDGDLAIVSSGNEEGEVLTVSLSDNNGKWVLDSGCTYHMCPNQEWFQFYNKINSGQVLLGNNMACKVVAIGNVRIQLHDGTVKVLSGVRHVPELKRNLISLAMLHESSYTCKT